MDLLSFPLCRQCWLASNDAKTLPISKVCTTFKYMSLTETVQITFVVMQLSQYENVCTSVITSMICTYNSKGTLN